MYSAGNCRTDYNIDIDDHTHDNIDNYYNDIEHTSHYDDKIDYDTDNYPFNYNCVSSLVVYFLLAYFQGQY